MKLFKGRLVSKGTSEWWASLVLAFVSTVFFGPLVYHIKPFESLWKGILQTTSGLVVARLLLLTVLLWSAYLHFRTLYAEKTEQRVYPGTILVGILLALAAVTVIVLWIFE